MVCRSVKGNQTRGSVEWSTQDFMRIQTKAVVLTVEKGGNIQAEFHSSWISFRAHIWLIRGWRVEKNYLESQSSTNVIKWSEFTQCVLLGEYRTPWGHGSIYFTPLSLALGIITKNKQASLQFALKGAPFLYLGFMCFVKNWTYGFLIWNYLFML